MHSQATVPPEPPKKHKQGRKRTQFSDNVTASLAMPTTNPQPSPAPVTTSYWQMVTNFFMPPPVTPVVTQPNVNNDDVKKIESLDYLIKEHAERRVDLFFYLLVAVYNKQITIDKIHTIQQNGRGSAQFKTQACHSSLFPNVSLQKIPPSMWSMMWQMIAGKIGLENEISLKDTPFMEALNSTIELPKVVNDFDGKIENRGEDSGFIIDGCLLILNKAAKGEIDPRQGMNDFFKLMEVFFKAFEIKKKNQGAMRKVWEYQKAGTFKAANKDMTVRDDYLYMMLRIHPADINKVKMLSLVSSSALKPFYIKIQDEIFTSPPGIRPSKSQ